MIYVVVPHTARVWTHLRFFTSYSAAEQAVMTVSWALKQDGKNTDWCEIVAFDGLDELTPQFVYSVYGDRLHREAWATPSS